MKVEIKTSGEITWNYQTLLTIEPSLKHKTDVEYETKKWSPVAEQIEWLNNRKNKVLGLLHSARLAMHKGLTHGLAGELDTINERIKELEEAPE